MDKKIQKIKKLPPDLLEVELATFLRGAGYFLFKKKKTMIDILILGSWVMLTLVVVLKLWGGGIK